MHRQKAVIAPFNMKYLNDYYIGFDKEITKYQWPDPFDSIESARDVLQEFMNEMDKGETLFFSVLSESGKFVGGVEIHGLDGDCPELGVWIVRNEQNKGYAYEALSEAMRIACEKHAKKEFFYEADIRNEASARLLQRFRNRFDIIDQDVEMLTTDSGKELQLQGHIIRVRQE